MGSKYDTLKYEPSKYSSILSSPYVKDDDDDYTSSYSRKPPLRSSALGDDNGDGYSYSRKLRVSDDDTTPYSKKYSTSKSITEGEPGEGYYSRRSIRGTLETEGDNDHYTIRKSIRGTVEGLEPSDTTDYTSKRTLGVDLGSKYNRRSVSAEGSESSRYSIRSASGGKPNEDTEELINRYTKKRNTADEEEDVYAKFSRKYSRTESADKSAEEEVPRYSRRVSRKESIEPKNPEDDPYERYARKYLRNQEAQEEKSISKRSAEEEEGQYSKYSSKYLRAESSDRSQKIDEGKCSLVSPHKAIGSRTFQTLTDNARKVFFTVTVL